MGYQAQLACLALPVSLESEGHQESKVKRVMLATLVPSSKKTSLVWLGSQGNQARKGTVDFQVWGSQAKLVSQGYQEFRDHLA